MHESPPTSSSILNRIYRWIADHPSHAFCAVVVTLSINILLLISLLHPSQRDLALQLASEPAISETNEQTPDKEPIEHVNDYKKWSKVTVKRNDTLSGLFHHHHISNADLMALLNADIEDIKFKHLMPGDKLFFNIDPQHRLQGIRYDISPTDRLLIERTPTGFKGKLVHREPDVKLQAHSATITSSLFGAGDSAGIPDKITAELTSIFGWDIDFTRSIRKGDHFKVLYNEYFLDDKKIKTGHIMAAEFVNHGKTYTALRYTDNNGLTSYYTPTGYNLRRAFLRAPVQYTRISSRFSTGRYHPILHRTRAHHGVDFAAPRGTPIHATGSGRISFEGRKGGYGNVVMIRHNARYSTVYGHMQHFAKHLHRGSRVKQGQIIGYVGSTGLATGPHVHYEFRINGIHRDPLKIKFPHAHHIGKANLADFKESVQEILEKLHHSEPTHA